MTATIDSRPEAAVGPTAGPRSEDSAGAAAQRPNRHRPFKLGYLPALDGLRAIAVIAVLLYHADVAWMPGGFLGVDVFFVLSGYLITTLLLEGSAARGAPDLKRFYLRRARRLLPAMLAVVLGSTLLVITVATDDAGNQQRDVPGALSYVLNWVYIFTDQSYFEATGRPPMLEHLWSLAVEEQFYILWPWVFLLAWRMGGTVRVRRVALIGALASTALMAVLSIINGYPGEADPSRVYFGTDTHAMGLLLGAALATVWVPQWARADIAPGARRIVDAIGGACLLGLGLVLWLTTFESGLLYRGGFLGLAALVAVLIVAVTHPASRVGLGLGSAPLRYIGTRSYGIYLWHWPIFLVTRPGLDVPLTGSANLALRLLLTLAVAEASYRFLEMPVRRYGFAGAWRALLSWLRVRGGAFAAAAARPVLLVAVAAVAVGLMMARLYALPSEQNYLHGLTELLAEEQQRQAPQGQDPEQQAAAAVPPAAEQTAPDAATRAAPGLLGIGESVMIGAGAALDASFPGVLLDASIGRQGEDIVSRTAELAEQGLLREQVFVHMGSNGPIGEAGLRSVLDTLLANGVGRVAVVNIAVPRRWQDPNNDVIERVLAQYPQAALVDWHGAVLDDPDLVVADGIHPSGSGVARYATMVAEALASLPEPAHDDGFVDDEPVLQDEEQLRNHPGLRD